MMNKKIKRKYFPLLQAEQTNEEWEVSCRCWAAETVEWKYWQLLGESVSDQWWRQLAMASTTASAACHVAAATAAARSLMSWNISSVCKPNIHQSRVALIVEFTEENDWLQMQI